MLGASLLVVPRPSAEAFPGVGGCGQNVGDVRFHFDGAWTNLARDAVRNGILDWNGRHDHTGNRFVRFLESATPPSITVRHVPLGAHTYGQATGCTLMEINSRAEYQVAAFLRGIARHETGHIIGLAHTGTGASFNGDGPPAMSTCHSGPDTNSISQDDVASLNFDSSATDQRPLMANYAFADGLLYWGKTGGSLTRNSAMGAPGGSGYGEFEPSTQSDRLYQTVNFVHHPGAQSLRAQAAAKRWATLLPNTLTLELHARDVDYPAGNDCALGGDQYVTGTNLNVPTYGVWSERRQLETGMFGIWMVHETDPWTTYADGSQDVRVRAGAFAGQPFHVDNLTIECTQTVGFRCTAP